jgi:catechol 2,3-dioxygenase
VVTVKPEFITFGTLHLDIRDLERSIAFWRDLVGLRQVEATNDSATLGVDGDPLVVLHRSATRPVERGYSGLFHLAIHVPSESELARIIGRLRASGNRFGASDHIVAKSLYLNDPDGIGLEIAFETPDRVRSFQWDEGADGPLVIDSEGRRRRGIEPLDLEEILTTLQDGDVTRPLPSGTIVGHLQFQVGNLEGSYRFYRDKIGLIPSMYAPWSGYGDLGAGGRVAHRIALNTWQGAGAPPRPSEVAGLRRFTIRFRSPERLQDAIAKIGNAESRDGAYLSRDPDMNEMVLTLDDGASMDGK